MSKRLERFDDILADGWRVGELRTDVVAKRILFAFRMFLLTVLYGGRV